MVQDALCQSFVSGTTHSHYNKIHYLYIAWLNIEKRAREEEVETSECKVAKFDTLSLSNQDVCDGSAGNLIRVDGMQYSGLKPTPLLYVRDDVKRIWECLSLNRSQSYVHGPPGVGISSVVWAWARYAARHKTVYWVHCSCFDYTYCVLRGNQVVKFSYTNMQGIIEFISMCEDGILIADGLTESLRIHILPDCNLWQRKTKGQLKIVSSEPLKYDNTVL